MSRLALLSILLAAFACSTPKTNNVPDGGAVPRCGVPAPPACTATALLDHTFQIDALGEHEIASATAFDGTLWIAYSRGDMSDASANLQVWLTHLGCDGTVLLAPVQVNTDNANDVDPTIAVSDGVVLVAWLSDSGNFPNNLTFGYRLYGASDAAPLSSTQLTLRSTRDGQAVDANMLAPSVAPLPGGGFVIAGTRSSADETTYQAFAQRLDAAGGLVGPTIDASLEADTRHENAAVTAGPDGTLYLVWGRESKDGNDISLLHTSVAPEASIAQPAAETYHQTSGFYPTMSSQLSSCSRPYMAFEAPLSSTHEVMVVDAASTDASKPVLEIFIPNTFAVGPQVAASDDGGAVAWLSESASDPLIFVQRFKYDGTTWQLGKRVQVPPLKKFAIQAPSLTHISGNVYVVTWKEGSGPQTYSYARLVSLDD